MESKSIVSIENYSNDAPHFLHTIHHHHDHEIHDHCYDCKMSSDLKMKSLNLDLDLGQSTQNSEVSSVNIQGNESQNQHFSLGNSLQLQYLQSLPLPVLLPPPMTPMLHFPHFSNAQQSTLHRIFYIVRQLGSGSYGEVFLAIDIMTRECLAIKKMRMDENISDDIVKKECSILQTLNHRNVVKLKDVLNVVGHAHIPRSIMFVFELCFCDLWSMILSEQVHLTLSNIKSIMQQLLEGLRYIHSLKIIHRDLKLSNILITEDGVAKIADFGMARYECPRRFYSPNIATLHYRSPELLLGSTNYGPAVDVWSLGCIFVELFNRSRFIHGDTEHAQLLFMTKLFGTIDRASFPPDLDLPYLDSIVLPVHPQGTIDSVLEKEVKDAHAIDLLRSMLQLNPERRLNCSAALGHDFFSVSPCPVPVRLVNRNNQVATEINDEHQVSSSSDGDAAAVDQKSAPLVFHHHFLGWPMTYQPPIPVMLSHFYQPDR